jgi:hypothetical protein
MYGWSLTRNGEPKYKDSLLYVDIQDLGNNKRIITLDQSYKNGVKGLDTKISLDFGERCKYTGTPTVTNDTIIHNDLYLIRNALGEYLSVPLWSISDSAYWVVPERGEDPTRIPAYQWAVINLGYNSLFRIVNREFENVEFIVTLTKGTAAVPFQILTPHTSAKFNNKFVYPRSTEKTQALHQGQINPYNFVNTLASQFPNCSFLRLANDVKQNELLGYKYIDPDSTIIDVYAFKYYNGLSMGANAKFLSWNGYDENSSDTTLWAKGQDEFDKLYF